MEAEHVLDYKCGEGHPLSSHLKPEKAFKYQAYDANIPEYSDEPVPADMVVCIDGLSRMTQAGADETLDELAELTKSVIFLTISTNWQPIDYWLPIIMERFAIQRVQVTEDGSFCVVAFHAWHIFTAIQSDTHWDNEKNYNMIEPIISVRHP